MDDSVVDDLIAMIFWLVFIVGLLETKEIFGNSIRATYMSLMYLKTGAVLLKM